MLALAGAFGSVWVLENEVATKAAKQGLPELPGPVCVGVTSSAIGNMQPSSPQLPTDAPASPAPQNLKKGALLLFLIVLIAVGFIAFMLPEKNVEATKNPTQAPHSDSRTERAQADAYKKPVL